MQCPPPVEPADAGMNAIAVALKEMYDLYGLCAGRLIELNDWIVRGTDEPAGH